MAELTCADCVHYIRCIFHVKGNENENCNQFIDKADFVEVVRCYHCDHFLPCEGSDEGYCVELQRGMPNNGFCCLAKRKEKGHE
jgi:hypothetical protein